MTMDDVVVVSKGSLSALFDLVQELRADIVSQGEQIASQGEQIVSQEERISNLESENEEQTQRIEVLETENVNLTHTVEQLHEVLRAERSSHSAPNGTIDGLFCDVYRSHHEENADCGKPKVLFEDVTLDPGMVALFTDGIYSEVEVIHGNVIIVSQSYENVDFMRNVRYIGGYLSIYNNAALTNVDGLSR